MTIEEVIEEYEHNLDYTNRSYANTRLEVSIESYASQQISKVVSEIESKLPKKESTDAIADYRSPSQMYNKAIDEVHKVLEGYKK